MAATTVAPSIVRDRFTWLAYFTMIYFGYLQSSLGPMTPFLRAELGLNYTVTAFYLSAFAIGIVVSGLLVDQIAVRWGRSRLFWGAGVLISAGVLLLVFGTTAPVTIAGALLLGLCGGSLIVTTQSAASDRYGERRSVVLIELAMAVSLGGILSPLLIGYLENIGIGWRGALLLGVVGYLLLVCFFHDAPIPAMRRQRNQPKVAGKLPAAFWAYAAVLVIIAATQWSIIFWSSDFMHTAAGLSQEFAATVVSLFFAAFLLGRMAGSYLVRRWSGRAMLLGSVLLAMCSFPLFWLVPLVPVKIAGLFLTGLAMSNLFPLTIAAAVATQPDQVDTITARMSLGTGVATLVMPQLLGSLADQIGIQAALGVIPVLLVFMVIMMYNANYLARTKRVLA